MRLNMWYESDLDSLMRRTRNRPIPSGKITSDEAKAFGFALAGISVVMLGLAANWFAALFLLFTIFLLRGHLYNVAEKMDATEYCHWWRRWCLSTDDWLGRCYFRNIDGKRFNVFVNISMDPTTFLGSSAFYAW